MDMEQKRIEEQQKQIKHNMLWVSLPQWNLHLFVAVVEPLFVESKIGISHLAKRRSALCFSYHLLKRIMIENI